MILYHAQPAFFQLVGHRRENRLMWPHALAATLCFALFLHARNFTASYLPFVLFFMLSFTVHLPRLEQLPLFRTCSALADRLSLMVFFNHALAIQLTRHLARAHGWNNGDKVTMLFLGIATAIAVAGDVIVSRLVALRRHRPAERDS